MHIADTSGGCKPGWRQKSAAVVRTLTKRAVLWAYSWHLISAARTQAIVNRHQLWGA